MDLSFFRGDNIFLGLAAEDCVYEQAKAVVLPVPYDSTTSYRAGTREGPQAIIAASKQVELYDLDLQTEPITSSVHTLPELDIDMSGPKETIARLEHVVSALIKDDKFPIILGGEHSITTAPVKALKQKYSNLSVLQLDAHSDLRDSYENTIYNHASVMRRVIEYADLTQVGIRNTSKEEIEFIKSIKHDKIFWASQIHQFQNNKWMDQVLDKLGENVYITIDLDVFDPSIMPAVGTPEPGGLLWYQTLEFLNKVVDKKNIVGFDVVELCPIHGNIASDFMAAKLVFKILGRIFIKNGWNT